MGKSTTRTRLTVLEGVTTVVSEHQREIWLLAGLLGCTFAVVSLIGYSPGDPTWLHPGVGLVENPCGPLGALMADLLFQVFGYGAWGAFYGMVACVLALARRPAADALKTLTVLGFVLSALAMADLAFGPGDAFPPGGWVGGLLAQGLTGIAGTAGAWLVLLGSAGIGGTVLFRIRWGRVAGSVVGAGENLSRGVVGGVGNVAQGAGGIGALLVGSVVARIRADFRALLSQVGEVGDRMAHAIRRRDESDWRTTTDFEAIEGDPDQRTPASVVDATAVSHSVALAEVHWQQTDEGDASELLDLFPAMTPRLSATSAASSRRREEPTRPSDAPQRSHSPRDSALGRGPADSGADLDEVPVLRLAPARAPNRAAPSPTDEATPPSAPVRHNRPAALPPDLPPRNAPVEVDDDLDDSEFEDEDEDVDEDSDEDSDEDVLDAPVRGRSKAPAPPAKAGNVAPLPTPHGAQVRRAAFLDRSIKDDGGAVAGGGGPYALPKLSLLDPVPAQRAEFNSEALRVMAVKVEETLASFKVAGEVTDVRVGPVVTTLEFLPEKGITVRRIASLADDLAMGLCATSVRIVAPIPGKGVVGIEIPSDHRMTIYLRELLASTEFRDAQDFALPVVLGKDVEGAPMVADLAKMPHLLVGGTTGSGKSVGVNGMLMSLLYRRTPDELRMLLIDPKKLEFKMYEDIPHLLHPVVTEPKKAAAALAWACREMDSRYELLARFDTRNIDGYNRKVEVEVPTWGEEKARRYAPANWPAHDPVPTPQRLPYIVIVIDELADLMLVAKKEVEGSIARLTQMARACGIHIIVATQRPSVDVVTGLIKSNLPTRISFKLRSGTDSRTILDQVGAESLLGRGDSLYLPNAGDISRVHGPFVSDDEVLRVMEYLRGQGKPQYIESITDEPSADGSLDDDELDPLYPDAVQVVRQQGKASTSLVQRFLKIGYNRAARIIEQMEARGVVGPADGARPREVLSMDV